jgi:hypothetical protein
VSLWLRDNLFIRSEDACEDAILIDFWRNVLSLLFSSQRLNRILLWIWLHFNIASCVLFYFGGFRTSRFRFHWSLREESIHYSMMLLTEMMGTHYSQRHAQICATTSLLIVTKEYHHIISDTELSWERKEWKWLLIWKGSISLSIDFCINISYVELTIILII